MQRSRNVTDVLLRYLDAKQHVWNSYFWGKVTDLRECEPLDSFEEIDRRLFFALVCFPLNIRLPENYIFRNIPLRCLAVRPKAALSTVELMLSKPSRDGNTYWDMRTTLPSKSLTLSFIEFFQWDKYGFWSCPLVRCHVHAAATEEHIGRAALVGLANVGFFLDSSAEIV